MLHELAVSGYRSLRDIHLPLGRCTLIVGANGVGKTNVYRAIEIAAAAAHGTLGRTIAFEGGLDSIAWAGPRKRDEPAHVSIGLAWENLRYQLVLGRPNPKGFGFPTRFSSDPIVLEEHISFVETGKKKGVMLAERGATSCFLRDTEGARVTLPAQLVASESFFSQIAQPQNYPELFVVRRELESFRFYHSFRTDADAPMRSPRVGTRTPMLAHDGSDLAAAIVTLEEIGDGQRFHTEVARAFRGSSLVVDCPEGSRFVVTMQMPGIARPLHARELSDGTLRYLCLLTALLSPQPAPLIVLNEPETSLHPELLLALAHPIVEAASRSQVLVLTHSQDLARDIADLTATTRVELVSETGETRVGMNWTTQSKE